MWGKGSSKLDPAADGFVDSFYEQTPIDPAWDLEEKTEMIMDFITQQQAKGVERLVVITSGSVAVALDAGMVTYMDSLGSGNRGAACAEQFLRRKYAVVFLHRSGSLRPFSRLFAKQIKEGELLDRLTVNPENGSLELNLQAGSAFATRLHRMMIARSWYKDRLLELPFEEVHEYLFLIRAAALAIAPLNEHAMLFLSAGLLKRHVPHAELKQPRDAPASTAEEPIKTSPLPHVLRKIRTSWCPRAYSVTFKLEDDPVLLSERAHKQMERWGAHLVVGNVVTTRRNQVLLVTEREELRLVADRQVELEASLTKSVVEYHKQHLLERQALERSKPLLVLSAKFCMMRENVSVVDEDADGNKDVPFKVGVRIRSNRSKAPGGDASSSPIYVLRSVIKNSSGSARCQLWQMESRAGDPGELIVAFSPAGTPDTIVHYFNDVWKGWLEDEVKKLREGAKQIPLASYLSILASPMTGDFSELTLLWDSFTRSVVSAWREGERPRVVQAMRNLFLLGFDRGLSVVEGLLPPEALRLPVRQTSEDPFNPGATGAFFTTAATQASRVRQSFVREVETDMDDDDLVHKASTVRVHNGIRKYFEDMLQEEDFLQTVVSAYQAGSRVVVTGYSMGGMLAQLFVLFLGERIHRLSLDTDRVTMVTFGSPRVGDEGFRARLRLLYHEETKLMNVLYPLDTVHAFPPNTEGYSDATVKIFLRQKGQFVARRHTSRTQYTTLKWLRVLDSKIDEVIQAKRRRRQRQPSLPTSPDSSRASSPAPPPRATSPAPPVDPTSAASHAKLQPPSSEPAAPLPLCDLCGLDTHVKEQHRCHICTERGTHRGSDCPNRHAGCKLCGRGDHATGEHQCSVCKLPGHRGRDCHSVGDVGVAELAAYFSFHDYLYARQGLDNMLDPVLVPPDHSSSSFDSAAMHRRRAGSVGQQPPSRRPSVDQASRRVSSPVLGPTLAGGGAGGLEAPLRISVLEPPHPPPPPELGGASEVSSMVLPPGLRGGEEEGEGEGRGAKVRLFGQSFTTDDLDSLDDLNRL